MKFFFVQLKESFGFAWQSLAVNRLRTTLSLFGVTIGIFSIIFVLSVVDSMEADMKEGLSVIGSDLLFIQKWPLGPEKEGGEYEWWKYFQRRAVTENDMALLTAELPDIQYAALQVKTFHTAEYKNNAVTGIGAIGVTYEYNQAINLDVEKGRYFLRDECDGGRPSAIIGPALADQLFGDEYPIGRHIKINGNQVEVIGILKKEGSSLFGGERDLACYIPFAFAKRFTTDQDEISMILKGNPSITADKLKGEVIALFRGIRGIRPGADNDFSVIESSMISAMVNNIVGVFNVAGMFIGIFAILVGAFGIANIMFVSVKERTNLIGIQKSLGAKNYFILSQFLFESILLCIAGGTIGLILVFGLLSGLNALSDFHFFMPLSRIAMGLSISVIVGLLAGFIPAKQASRLSPVEAIRSKG